MDEIVLAQTGLLRAQANLKKTKKKQKKKNRSD